MTRAGAAAWRRTVRPGILRLDCACLDGAELAVVFLQVGVEAPHGLLAELAGAGIRVGHPLAAFVVGDSYADAVRDANPNVRSNACWALGELGSERALVALKNALEDGDPSVPRGSQPEFLLGEPPADHHGRLIDTKAVAEVHPSSRRHDVYSEFSLT